MLDTYEGAKTRGGWLPSESLFRGELSAMREESCGIGEVV